MLTTQAFQAGMFSPNQSEVSPSQLSDLLGRRKFKGNSSENPFIADGPVSEYSQEDLTELEKYCSKMGIIGVAFKGQSPKMVLQMLKAKMGYRESNESKKGILHG